MALSAAESRLVSGLLVCLYVMVLVVIMHRANIGRLLRGEEKKFSLGKKT